MKFGISFSFWIYYIFCEASSWRAFAYFGLTGKDHITNLKPLDQDAVFMGDDNMENAYQWNDNGYYTAPSKSYERIDLSPQPDDQEVSLETRSTKNSWQKRTRSTPDRPPRINEKSGVQKDSPVQANPSTSSHSIHYRRHAEPYPDQPRRRLPRYPQQIRRRPYSKQAYMRERASRPRDVAYTPKSPNEDSSRVGQRNDYAISRHRQADHRDNGRIASKGYRRYHSSPRSRPKKGGTARKVSGQEHSNVDTDQSSPDESYKGSQPVTDSSLPPEIRPLFVTDDISSIMNYMTVDSNGQMKLNNENIQTQNALSAATSSNASDMKDRETSVPLVSVEDINRKQARKQCDELTLTRKQRRMCKKDSGLPQILREAMVMSVSECQYQFRFERWNCTIGRTRVHLLSRGNKETAFLFAISSAGLAHSVAKGCAKGYLELCSCDETYSDYVNQEAWMWGGCGDNVHAAAKFVRKFLRPKYRSEDIRAEVDKHNSNLGIRMVRRSVFRTCKCHGVSGSCTTKTCWKKIAPFYKIGHKLKNAYNKSVRNNCVIHSYTLTCDNTEPPGGSPVIIWSSIVHPVGSVNSAGGETKLVKLKRTRRNRPEIATQNTRSPPPAAEDQTPEKRDGESRNSTILRTRDDFPNNPRNNELVYLENSPQYCKRTRYSLGTQGRLCDKHKNCDRICCGRGYTTQVRTVHRSCECEVRWCCYVECKTCVETKEVHTCK